MKKSASKKSGLFLKFAVITFCLYIVVVLFQLQVQIRDKREELNRLKNEIAVQEQENMESRRFIDDDNVEDYIEQYAREKLGFARPDERVYYNVGG